MSGRQLIEVATRAGLALTVNGPDLLVEADSDIPEALLAELRSHKPEVIAALAQAAASTPSSHWASPLSSARARNTVSTGGKSPRPPRLILPREPTLSVRLG